MRPQRTVHGEQMVTVRSNLSDLTDDANAAPYA
jgi:hypothetical protein